MNRSAGASRAKPCRYHAPIEVVEAKVVEEFDNRVECVYCGKRGTITTMKLEAGGAFLYRSKPMICCAAIRDSLNAEFGAN